MICRIVASLLASAALLAAAGAEPLKIRGAVFANWWRIGESVCFKGDQPIPENDRIRVKVTDVTGKPVFTGEVGGREFNEKGWCWQPPSPGYFEAEFHRTGSVTGDVSESYRFRVHKQDRRKKIFPRRRRADSGDETSVRRGHSHPDATWINICIQEYKTVVPKQMEGWKNFIRRVMRRYPGVKKYELWNEPHLIGYSCFRNDSVENFVALLKAGCETVKAENPEAIVHLGGIGMRYLPFYRELLKLGGDRCYDVLPMHGSWVQMAPFRRMEKEFGRKSRPWLSSEWHAMLLRASFPWPSGIGGAKSPAEYGDLTVWQQPRDLLKNRAFQPFRPKADQRLIPIGNGYRVEAGAIGEKDASGLAVGVGTLLPNASYLLTFRARGTARIEVVCFANRKRINLLKRTALKENRQEFSLILNVPEKTKSLSLNMFAWEQPNVFFELEDIRLTPRGNGG